MDAHERRALPEGWEWKKLGEVIKYKKGRKPAILLDQEIEGSLQYLTAEYFRTGTSENFVPKEEISKCISCSKHDIILIWDGSNAGDIFMGLNGVVASTMVKIEPKGSLLESYAHFFLKTQFQNFREHTNGSSIPHVNKSSFDNTKIPLPPLPTQRRIVSILEKAEETKRLRAQADSLTDRLLQSVFLEMFGDTMRNPKGWEIKNMGTEIKDIRYGTGSPPEYQKEGIPFIRATNIKKGTVQKEGLVYISKEEANKIKKCEVQTGDLILVISGVNTGDCARISPEYAGAYAGYDLVIQMPYPKNYYYNFIINSDYGKSVIKPLSRRAGQPHINADQVKSLQLPLPSVQLLEKFARIVGKIETMRQSQNQSKQQIEDLFCALMQKAFRGEI